MSSNGFLYVLIFILLVDPNFAGLYNESDDVFILNDNNFNANIIGSENSWMVEFYNSWCGHCVRFAPIWKNLASECKGWKKLIRVAAIDCAQKDNTNVCMHYNIKSYPTVVYLAALSSSRPEKLELDVMFSMDGFKHQMIDFIVNGSLSNLSPSKLQPLIPLKRLSDVWTDSHDQAVIIYEAEVSYLGREVILNLYDQMGSFIIARIIENNPNASSPTSSYLISKDGQKKLLARSDNINEHLNMIATLKSKNQDEKLLEGRKDVMESVTGGFLKNSRVKNESSDNPNIDWGSNWYMKVHESDLVSTLMYSLRREIPLQGNISADKFNLIIEHLRVLSKYLPIKGELVERLKQIIVEFELQRSLDKFKYLSGRKWLETVDLVFERNNYPDEERWVSCLGSSPGLRGYPCGLWMTFHAITVNAAQRATDDDCMKTLLSVKNYVQNFFGCQECRMNFMKGASRIKSLVNNCKQAAIFLWRSHNKANLRLKGDPSEDPKHPKTYFPNKFQCPSCHVTYKNYKSISGLNDGWNEDEVLKFLAGMYKSSAVIGLSLPKYELASKQNLSKTLFAYGMDNDTSDTNVVNIFNRYDIGVCMAFYCICIFLIVAVYLHFIKKRRLCHIAARLKQQV